MFDDLHHVESVADARAGLSSTLRRFRADPDTAPVVIGSHRRPEAVLVPFSTYLRSSDKSVVTLDRLRELADVIMKLARASSLSDVRVFGSVARGEARPGSDVDLLITPTEGTTLFDIAQFEFDLEAILGRSVSAVSVHALGEGDANILETSVAL